MLPNLEAHAAAKKLERQRTLRHAEHRALLLVAATQPRSASAGVTVETASVRWGRLARAIRPLGWMAVVTRKPGASRPGAWPRSPTRSDEPP
jgi:hypothetical protein